jgi:aminopeptidase N
MTWSNKLSFYLILTIFVSCNERPAVVVTPEDGISFDLAEFRKKQVSEIIYRLAFSIPSDIEDSIPSQLDLQLFIHDLSQPLQLDFRPDNEWPVSVIVNDRMVPSMTENEHLVIPTSYLVAGKNSINIKFIAGELSLNRNNDYLYTLLVPARASTLFPCFDQPDIKASYILNITAPAEWKVLAGAPLDYKEQHGSVIEHQFKQTEQMSTYLFSFVAGKFQLTLDNQENFPIQMLYRETDTIKINSSITSIFELHRLSIEFLEDYTSYSFPFQKLDMATIPGYQYGGMEHVGAIQYRESTLFLDASATLSQRLNRAKLIAHETAHMWFGDLVTMKWFDDVWLKEVFANLMADKIINPAFPEVDHQLQFLTAHYPAAYNVDRTMGTHPIKQHLPNLKNAGSLYGSIIYHKAPIMMRQLEATLGADSFRRGIASYIHKYAHDNASWEDLIEILDDETPLDLKQWSEVWVHSAGRPVISGNLQYDADQHITSFEVIQHAEDGTDKIWPQLFEVTMVYPDSSTVLQVNSNKKITDVSTARGFPKPDLIIYNSNGYGYGIFPVDHEQLAAIPEIKDHLARGYSYINSFENTLNGALTADQTFQLLLKGLQTETKELILRQITRQLGTIYWKYLTAPQQAKHLPELHEMLFDRLQANEPPNVKKNLFILYKSLAYGENQRKSLYDIWSKKLVIPNLILNQNDYTDIALHLALFQHEETEKILQVTATAITNPDRQQRFEFLIPAAAGDDQERTAYFESFRSPENREKESWVLTACYFIHHPLRQQQAVNSLSIALEMLEEIQQTGDIFFPKGWLDNTIGLYSSKAALRILDDYLGANPDLNAQLKLKLLQSADDLKRSQLQL